MRKIFIFFFLFSLLSCSSDQDDNDQDIIDDQITQIDEDDVAVIE